jgi:hypothetical protein
LSALDRAGCWNGFARQLLPTFALFRLTPPTALIVDETAWFIAAMNHLLRLGLRVPDDVSLVSTDDHPTLHCCHPPVARIAWDSGPVIRRIPQSRRTTSVTAGRTSGSP